MKNKITALALFAVAALTFAPKPAQASDKGLAALGGFVGGLIVGSEISHARDYPVTAPAVVVYDRGYRAPEEGYWQVVNTRVWVPGYWIVERARHGRSYRSYVEGHYEFRPERVWVRVDRRSDHRDLEYGYDHR